MELDDLKNSWQDAGKQAEKQQQLIHEMTEQVTRARYRSVMNKIAYPEIAGILICIAGAFFVGIQFNRLNTLFLQGIAVVAIIVLITVSVVSLLSIRQFYTSQDMNLPYADALKAFALKKIRFHQFQRLNLVLSHLLMVTVIILITGFFSKRAIAGSKYFLTFAFSAGYLFLLFYSKGVYKYYNHSLRKAEDFLKELAG